MLIAESGVMTVEIADPRSATVAISTNLPALALALVLAHPHRRAAVNNFSRKAIVLQQADVVSIVHPAVRVVIFKAANAKRAAVSNLIAPLTSVLISWRRAIRKTPVSPPW